MRPVRALSRVARASASLSRSSDGAALLEVCVSAGQDLGRRVLSDEGAFEAVKKLIRERGKPSLAGSLPEAVGP
ncbi:hypothetical protein GCM10009647_066710 [Streptomyces sanglieri]